MQMGTVAPSLAYYTGGVMNHTERLDNPYLKAQNLATLPAPVVICHGIIGEQDIMDAMTLPLVKMPNHDGFVPDSWPDVGKASKRPKR